MNNIKVYRNTNEDIFKDSEISFNNNSFIIEENSTVIGHFNIMNMNGSIVIDYELLKQFRNKGLGKHLLEIIENFVIQNYDTNRILLLIKYNNLKSRIIAVNSGYDIDFTLCEEMNRDGEMTSYTPYYKMVNNVKKKVLN